MAIIKSHSHSLTLVICSFVSIAQIAQIRTTETTPYPTPPLLSYYVTLSRRAEQLLFSLLCSKITVYCQQLKCFL